MPFRVIFAQEAEDDLLELATSIAERAGLERALTYTDRIEAACLALAQFPQRGTARDDIRRGLRTIGFERRATIAFHVGPNVVTITRILYGGRDLGAAL